MMTDEQRFIFDVQGYLLVPGVLSKPKIKQMLDEMAGKGLGDAQNDPSKSRFGGFLGWGPLWRDLIDHPKIFPLLVEMMGPYLRIDHAYGMAMRAAGKRGGEGLHNRAGMLDHGIYYISHGNLARNGLMVVSWALTDAPLGSGGFCCIPGSHKALYPVPKNWYDVHDNPMVKQIPMRAGDVVIFTESLTHGTMAWTDETHERRSVLLKYCPGYMQWGQKPMDASKIEGLTKRQKKIMEGAYVWERAKATED